MFIDMGNGCSRKGTTVKRLLKSPTILIMVLLCSTLGSLWSLIIWKVSQDRATAFAKAASETQGLTHSLAQHASKSFGAVALALFGIKQYVEHSDRSARASAEINDLLAQFVKNLPQVRELGILSPVGSWVYSSFKTVPTGNNADREYFQYHLLNSDWTVRISDPLTSRVTGRPTVLLTQRLSNPDGSFAGVVFAAIDLSYFRSFYRSFELNQSRTVVLLKTTGKVIVQQADADIGKDLSKTDLFARHLLDATSGLYEIRSPFDGLKKQLAYEVAADFPVVITVAVADENILRAWKHNLRSEVYLGVVISIALMVLATMLWLQTRRRSQMARLLRERERGYRLFAENVDDVVTRVNTRGERLYISPSVKKLLGWDATEIIKQGAYDNVHPNHRPTLKSMLESLGPDNRAASYEYMARRKDGTYVWLEAKLNYIQDQADAEIVAVVRDISIRKEAEDALTEANAQLKSLSETDSLTSIANRRRFDQVFEQEMRRWRRTGRNLSVILIDVDKFKLYNDVYGHGAGDQCLRTIAKTLAVGLKRPADCVARYGGEEFAVILPDTTLENAQLVAEGLRKAVYDLRLPHERSSLGVVTISLGVAGAIRSEKNNFDLMVAADGALYRAKESGRNCVCAAETETPALAIVRQGAL